MTDLNSFSLTGRIAGKPRLSSTKNGTTTFSFCLAVNRDKQINGVWTKTAAFYWFTVYGARAPGLYKYISKGLPVGVSGHIDQDRFQDETGKMQYKTKLVPDNVALLGKNEAKPQSHSDTEPVSANIPQFEEAPFIPEGDFSEEGNLPPSPLPEGEIF